MKQNLSLQQKLLQKLSPQQIQVIKLLEIPTLQLEQRIKKELEENPVLELEQDGQEPEEDNEIRDDDTPDTTVAGGLQRPVRTCCSVRKPTEAPSTGHRHGPRLARTTRDRRSADRHVAGTPPAALHQAFSRNPGYQEAPVASTTPPWRRPGGWDPPYGKSHTGASTHA